MSLDHPQIPPASGGLVRAHSPIAQEGAHPDAAATSSHDQEPANQRAVRRSQAQLWAHRFFVVAFVFFCTVLGVILVILPWRPEWTDNTLILSYPRLRAFAGNSFVRGFCSGLGVLDVWIGFWEAAHYHEDA